MADIIQHKRGNATSWVNNRTFVLADGELGIERLTKGGRIKVGDGVSEWNELDYVSVGADGPKGDKGDFLNAVDLIGSSTYNITLSSDAHLVSFLASLHKEWVPGMFITVAYQSNPKKFMIGQCQSYDPNTGDITLFVDQSTFGLTDPETPETYSDWVLSWAASAATTVKHAQSHLPGSSYDPLPLADSLSPGFITPEAFTIIDNLKITGAYIGNVQPPNMLVGAVWFNSGDVVITAPSISAIYNQYVGVNEIHNIMVSIGYGLGEEIPELLVTSSGDNNPIPLSCFSVTSLGGGYRQITFNPLLTSNPTTYVTAGLYSIAIRAIDNSNGVFTDSHFILGVSATLYTVTTSVSGGNGTVYPDSTAGTVYVAENGSIEIEPRPTIIDGQQPYAVSTMYVNGVLTPLLTSKYVLSNVQNNQSVEFTYALGQYITILQNDTNGTTTPNGVLTVATNGITTILITGNTGWEFGSVIVDSISYGANSGTHTINNNDTVDVYADSIRINAITTSHTVIPSFTAVLYSISWSGLYASLGTINNSIANSITGLQYGMSQSFNLTPATDYEINTVLVDNAEVWTNTGSIIESYTIYPILKNYVVSATFRIQVPPQVTGVACVVTNATTNTITWSTASRATSYTVYWSTTEPTDAEELISTGTAMSPTSSLTIPHSVADTSVPYYYTVLASNSTGRATLGSVVVDNQNALPSSSLEAILPTRPIMRTGYSLPIPAAVNVLVTIELVASMNVEADAASMAESFKLYSNAARTIVVPGAVSQDSPLIWRLIPTANLTASTKYYPRVSIAAKSLEGIPVRNEIVWEFTTA